MSVRKLGLATFRKTVTSAGTAESLSATEKFTSFMRIRALSTNTGKIFYGDINCDNTYDWMEAEEWVELDGSRIPGTRILEWDLSNLYIDAEVNGEGVVVTYQMFDD